MAEQRPAAHRPDFEALSAWLDDALDEGARHRLAEHLAVCPACAAELAALRELSAGFVALRTADPLGVDLSGVVAGRLAAAERRPPAAPQPTRRRWQDWLPATLAAAVSLALGVGLGSALPGSGGAPPTLVSALSVFDPMPPGSVCVGIDACYPKGMPR